MKLRIALGDITIDEKLLLIKYLQDTLHISRPKAYLLLRGEKFYCNMDNDEMCKFVSNIQSFNSNVEWFGEKLKTITYTLSKYTLEPIYPLGCTKQVPDWFHGGTPPVNKNKKRKKK